MGKVYISGPITGIAKDIVERDFGDIETALSHAGYEVINPAAVLSRLPETTTWQQYMSMCYLMIDMSDAVLMMDGWRDSTGASIEYGYALGSDKIIVNNVNELISGGVK